MDGLIEGRIVHYVTQSGNHRPAIIVQVWNKEDGLSNLQVFTDGNNDYQVRPEFTKVANVVWTPSIKFSEEPKPATWHWIERE